MQIISIGSLEFLSTPNFFWSGTTLQDFQFNDRKSWCEQWNLPSPTDAIALLSRSDASQTNLRTHFTAPYRHPNEDQHKTSEVDIINMFRNQRPQMFHQRCHTTPDGTITTNRLEASINGWVLTYLDGTTENALEFRQAMLDSFPFPDPEVERQGSGITVLEIFCAGIQYLDGNGQPSATRIALGCPAHAKVLAIMRVRHFVGCDEGFTGMNALGSFYYS